MPARAIASGTISFGLVAVPVKLYPATRSKNISFRLLHAKDRSRLRQQYICTTCGETVERNDMVKGYEYAKDQYAVLTNEEIHALEAQTNQSIELQEFVPLSQVDPVYFENSYLLGPDKGGHKPYRLLCEAMSRTGKCAVGLFATRGKEQLVLIRESHAGLYMHALYYSDEICALDEVDRGDAVALKPNEVDLAVKLVEQLASDSFDPSRYHDEFRAKLLEVIEKKVAGQDVVVAPPRAPRAQVIDLMEALKASLESRARKPAARAQAQAEPSAGAAEVKRKQARAKGRAQGGTRSTARAK